MTLRFRFLPFVLGLLSVAGVPAASAEDAYPTRPVTMVVPFAAGGPSDAVARSLAEAMRGPLGQTVVVENAGGAGGTIGAARVANAANDGYTVLLAHIGITTGPALYAKLPYDPVKDFAPVGLVATMPMLLHGRQDLPVKDFREFVDYARKHPGGISMANAGVGSASHLCSVLVMNAIGADFQSIPYKGTGPAMNDVLGKRVDAACVSGYTPGLPVKTFAVTTEKRLPEIPDVPTMQQAGLKDFEMGIWHGLWTPRGAPPAVVEKLAAALQAAQADPAFRERMAGLGTFVMDGQGNPEALEKQVQADTQRWSEILRKVGVTPQ
ncbi:MAG: tripartite tricarboxylate transporter substrate-binding protein [Pigmentiphaga sp.]|uniref:Bug family tripartite tricarboxylate transporter substrate binding protein n=1 Tax=Pigmentiphaga sp. TaxID=1977564 RepID=UPI0029BE0FBD|nr:tripartite tricarboxylate transporter substrate-binding protein [Pigmentiphaga sp.]MDX3907266.1 tripartite tricarboxylate transporter substrate-binding protein [Pigmentiphaga sp.]